MHLQVVYTALATTVGFLVAAGAHFGPRTLGRRAATVSSSTKLFYLFFAVRTTYLLPAGGFLSSPFASARRAYPATGRCPLSPLSPGAARRRGGRRALKAGALEHVPAEGLRTV